MRYRPFRCGHFRTTENTGHRSNDTEYCRICAKTRNDEWRRENRNIAPVLPPRPKLNLDNDPAVQLYRAERSKRQNVVVGAIESVRPQYAKAIEKPKGGRPVSVGRGRKSA